MTSSTSRRSSMSVQPVDDADDDDDELTVLIVKPDAVHFHGQILEYLSLMCPDLRITGTSLRAMSRPMAEVIVAQYPYIQNLFELEQLQEEARAAGAAAAESSKKLYVPERASAQPQTTGRHGARGRSGSMMDASAYSSIRASISRDFTNDSFGSLADVHNMASVSSPLPTSQVRPKLKYFKSLKRAGGRVRQVQQSHHHHQEPSSNNSNQMAHRPSTEDGTMPSSSKPRDAPRHGHRQLTDDILKRVREEANTSKTVKHNQAVAAAKVRARHSIGGGRHQSTPMLGDAFDNPSLHGDASTVHPPHRGSLTTTATADSALIEGYLAPYKQQVAKPDLLRCLDYQQLPTSITLRNGSTTGSDDASSYIPPILQDGAHRTRSFRVTRGSVTASHDDSDAATASVMGGSRCSTSEALRPSSSRPFASRGRIGDPPSPVADPFSPEAHERRKEIQLVNLKLHPADRIPIMPPRTSSIAIEDSQYYSGTMMLMDKSNTMGPSPPQQQQPHEGAMRASRKQSVEDVRRRQSLFGSSERAVSGSRPGTGRGGSLPPRPSMPGTPRAVLNTSTSASMSHRPIPPPRGDGLDSTTTENGSSRFFPPVPPAPGAQRPSSSRSTTTGGGVGAVQMGRDMRSRQSHRNSSGGGAEYMKLSSLPGGPDPSDTLPRASQSLFRHHTSTYLFTAAAGPKVERTLQLQQQRDELARLAAQTHLTVEATTPRIRSSSLNTPRSPGNLSTSGLTVPNRRHSAIPGADESTSLSPRRVAFEDHKQNETFFSLSMQAAGASSPLVPSSSSQLLVPSTGGGLTPPDAAHGVEVPGLLGSTRADSVQSQHTLTHQQNASANALAVATSELERELLEGVEGEGWSEAEFAFEEAIDYLMAGGTCMVVALMGPNAVAKLSRVVSGPHETKAHCLVSSDYQATLMAMYSGGGGAGSTGVVHGVTRPKVSGSLALATSRLHGASAARRLMGGGGGDKSSIQLPDDLPRSAWLLNGFFAPRSRAAANATYRVVVPGGVDGAWGRQGAGEADQQRAAESSRTLLANDLANVDVTEGARAVMGLMKDAAARNLPGGGGAISTSSSTLPPADMWSTDQTAHPLARKRAKVEGRIRTLLSDIVAACIDATSNQLLKASSMSGTVNSRRGEWKTLLRVFLQDLQTLLSSGFGSGGGGGHQHGGSVAHNKAHKRTGNLSPHKHQPGMLPHHEAAGSNATTTRPDVLLKRALAEQSTKIMELVALLRAEGELDCSEHDLARARELESLLPHSTSSMGGVSHTAPRGDASHAGSPPAALLRIGGPPSSSSSPSPQRQVGGGSANSSTAIVGPITTNCPSCSVSSILPNTLHVTQCITAIAATLYATDMRLAASDVTTASATTPSSGTDTSPTVGAAFMDSIGSDPVAHGSGKDMSTSSTHGTGAFTSPTTSSPAHQQQRRQLPPTRRNVSPMRPRLAQGMSSDALSVPEVSDRRFSCDSAASNDLRPRRVLSLLSIRHPSGYGSQLRISTQHSSPDVGNNTHQVRGTHIQVTPVNHAHNGGGYALQGLLYLLSDPGAAAVIDMYHLLCSVKCPSLPDFAPLTLLPTAHIGSQMSLGVKGRTQWESVGKHISGVTMGFHPEKALSTGGAAGSSAPFTGGGVINNNNNNKYSIDMGLIPQLEVPTSSTAHQRSTVSPSSSDTATNGGMITVGHHSFGSSPGSGGSKDQGSGSNANATGASSNLLTTSSHQHHRHRRVSISDHAPTTMGGVDTSSNVTGSQHQNSHSAAPFSGPSDSRPGSAGRLFPISVPSAGILRPSRQGGLSAGASGGDSRRASIGMIFTHSPSGLSPTDSSVMSMFFDGDLPDINAVTMAGVQSQVVEDATTGSPLIYQYKLPRLLPDILEGLGLRGVAGEKQLDALFDALCTLERVNCIGGVGEVGRVSKSTLMLLLLSTPSIRSALSAMASPPVAAGAVVASSQNRPVLIEPTHSTLGGGGGGGDAHKPPGSSPMKFRPTSFLDIPRGGGGELAAVPSVRSIYTSNTEASSQASSQRSLLSHRYGVEIDIPGGDPQGNYDHTNNDSSSAVPPPKFGVVVHDSYSDIDEVDEVESTNSSSEYPEMASLGVWPHGSLIRKHNRHGSTHNHHRRRSAASSHRQPSGGGRRSRRVSRAGAVDGNGKPPPDAAWLGLLLPDSRPHPDLLTVLFSATSPTGKMSGTREATVAARCALNLRQRTPTLSTAMELLQAATIIFDRLLRDDVSLLRGERVHSITKAELGVLMLILSKLV